MKKILKIFLKIFLTLAALAVATFCIIYLIYDEPLPSGKSGPQADNLAEKMLTAINNQAYLETRYLEWSFADGSHRYIWDKEKGAVQVEWDENYVFLNLHDPKKSKVVKNDLEIVGHAKDDLITEAVGYFNNDSFWLVAPFKVFDEGTQRSLVILEDGSDGLLVTYTSGGNTPGDSYLWKLDSNGFPESYRMWVAIIPIGGLEATWDDWQVMETGVFLPASHKLGPITLDMGEVRGYN